MQRYIAFLRGINLGKRRLPMSQLKDLFEELGFDAAPIADLDNAEYDEPPKTDRETHRLRSMRPAQPSGAADTSS